MAGDESYVERIRSSFAKQGLMSTLGATLGDVSPGHVVTGCPKNRPDGVRDVLIELDAGHT